MEIRQYKNLKLRVYRSYQEYARAEEIEMIAFDTEGNEVVINTDHIDFGGAMAKEHFASGDTFKPEQIMWEAITHEQDTIGIVAVILSQPSSISYKELLTTVGHEYGHIIDANKFQNSTEPYETDLGYEQEERKALAFEEFVSDCFEMTELFIDMLIKSEVELTKGESFSDKYAKAINYLISLEENQDEQILDTINRAVTKKGNF